MIALNGYSSNVAPHIYQPEVTIACQHCLSTDYADYTDRSRSSRQEQAGAGVGLRSWALGFGALSGAAHSPQKTKDQRPKTKGLKSAPAPVLLLSSDQCL